MEHLFRTLVITAQDANSARMIAAAFGTEGVGMWTTPLSASGLDPATHYISSGYIPAEFAALAPCTKWEQDVQGNWGASDVYSGDAATVYMYAQQGSLPLSLATIQDTFSRADCSPQEPFVHMGRMGLKIINP
jgi:hypothetical protein